MNAALPVSRITVETLIPYGRHALTHTEEQTAQISRLDQGVQLPKPDPRGQRSGDWRA